MREKTVKLACSCMDATAVTVYAEDVTPVDIVSIEGAQVQRVASDIRSTTSR